MPASEIEKRDSRALEPQLVSDPRARAEAEARNGFRQYDAGISVVQTGQGAILPDSPTIPDQIVDNRNPYFDALDAADAAWKDRRIDVSGMEELLGALLARQLASFYQAAGGKMLAAGHAAAAMR